MDNQYNISIRLSSDDYVFNNIEALEKYKIKIAKKGESIFTNSSFIARSNVLIVDNIYEKQISNINIKDNYKELINIFEILKNNLNNINYNKEIWLSCSINNDQFGFGIDQEFIDILSKYGYSLSISGIAIL